MDVTQRSGAQQLIVIPDHDVLAGVTAAPVSSTADARDLHTPTEGMDEDPMRRVSPTDVSETPIAVILDGKGDELVSNVGGWEGKTQATLAASPLLKHFPSRMMTLDGMSASAACSFASVPKTPEMPACPSDMMCDLRIASATPPQHVIVDRTLLGTMADRLVHLTDGADLDALDAWHARMTRLVVKHRASWDRTLLLQVCALYNPLFQCIISYSLGFP